jgi:pimeloyl-ACP methyl ester carboxylesterase
VSDFVLIHGGAHGSWCWEKVIPFLSDSARVGQVFAVDLIADAQAVTHKQIQDIAVADFVDGVVHRITSENLSDIVLVGHSMAGITIPGVAYRVPDRIKHVIYLTTSNPPVGQSIADLMMHPLSPISRNVGYEQMFCNDLDDETSRWLIRNLREDPPLPFQERVELCELPSGMRSTYIVCEQDLALPVEYQLEQARNAAVDEVLRLNSGHSAFASKPKELAGLLLQYAQNAQA